MRDLMLVSRVAGSWDRVHKPVSAVFNPGFKPMNTKIRPGLRLSTRLFSGLCGSFSDRSLAVLLFFFGVLSPPLEARFLDEAVTELMGVLDLLATFALVMFEATS